MKQIARMKAESMGLPILEPLEAQGIERPVALNKEVCVAGARAEVNLKLVSPLVSRTHAIFVADRDSIYLRDLASRNHTYLNREPIREAVLRNGDVIGLGPLTFRCKSGFDKPYDPTEVHAPPAELRDLKTDARIPLNSRSTVIGSRRDCDLVLKDDDVEPAHAIIFEREGRRYVRDLRSRTGTWVNEVAAGQVELNAGDEIRIGDARYTFQLAPARPADRNSDSAANAAAMEAAADASDDASMALELNDPLNEDSALESLLSGGAEGSATSEDPKLPLEEDEEAPLPLEPAAQAVRPLEPEAAAETESAPPAAHDVIPLEMEDSVAPAIQPEPPAEAEMPAEPVATDKEEAELIPAEPIVAEVSREEVSAWEEPPADDGIPLAAPTASAGIERTLKGDVEASSGSPVTHPGQHDRIAPEEKLTELLGELADNIAEVQSTWEEVRAKETEAPFGEHPGGAGRHASRSAEKVSAEPHGHARLEQRGASTSDDEPRA